MTEVRKISIHKIERNISPMGVVMKEKVVCIEGDNFEECSKEFDRRWKE